MAEASVEFEQLYVRHAPSVRRRARELLGSDAEANEIVQDLFVSLLERPAQYERRSSLTTFLYSATTHACLNRLRNHRTRARLLAQHAGSASPASAGARAERLLVLRDLLAQLPEPLAQVAVYHYLDEMTYDEIAEVMHCSRRHVANLLQRLSVWHSEREEPRSCPNP